MKQRLSVYSKLEGIAPKSYTLYLGRTIAETQKTIIMIVRVDVLFLKVKKKDGFSCN